MKLCELSSIKDSAFKILFIYPSMVTLNDPGKKCFENVGRKEMLVTSIFSFSHNVFHTFQDKFQIFAHILCHRHILYIWKSLKLYYLEKSKYCMHEITYLTFTGKYYNFVIKQNTKPNRLLNPFPNKPLLLPVCSTRLLKTL